MSNIETIKTKNTNSIFQFVKALIISLIITFACIIVFAIVIKVAKLDDGVIVPVNMIIKAISILVGTIIFTKSREKGLIKGLIFAAAYTLLSFIIFSALAHEFVFNFSLILDFIFSMIVGAITGIIRVNAKK